MRKSTTGAESHTNSTLRSALTLENPLFSLRDFDAWYQRRLDANRFAVERIPFGKLDKWLFEQKSGDLVHVSGKFFRIEGIRISANFGEVTHWEQPIINQPEVGILGILTRVVDGVRYFLMQAKMEPGNINVVQISPTVQATRSNFTLVHGGQKPLYLEYFLDHPRATVLVDQLQSEQGTRFLRKRNRNILIEIDDEVPALEDFCWLTLGQLKNLMRVPNLVNMDSRSVLSSVAVVDRAFRHSAEASGLDEALDLIGSSKMLRPSNFGRALLGSLIDREQARNGMQDVINWITDCKMRFALDTEYVPLKLLADWERTDEEIRHKSGRYFSVIAVAVEAGNREVRSWTQPLLYSAKPGITGFLVQRINGVLQFLVQARLEPGTLDIAELAPTLSCNAGGNSIYEPDHPPFQEYFLNAAAPMIHYDSNQSVEGGRFFRDQNRYMIVELDPSVACELPYTYRWLTLAQIMELIRYNNMVDVESRELLACLSFAQEE